MSRDAGTTRGPDHILDAGRYYADIVDGIPMIFRADPVGAVTEIDGHKERTPTIAHTTVYVVWDRTTNNILAEFDTREEAEAHLELIRPLGRYGLDGHDLQVLWRDYAGWRGHRDGSPQPQSDGYFEPTPGAPADACPHCGIHRRHAGDPLACGEGWKQPGCFDPKAKP